jgi:hypothetical protein
MGSIIQGALGFIGQRQSNEQQQEDFISNQQFNAQQAALNRQFQAGQQTSAENWMSEMSDTAMQRRVQDLKTAGLNPLLAIGQGGASTPGIGTPGGATASSGGIPSLPSALGAGVQSAQAAQLIDAQAKQADAQAAKTTAETPARRTNSLNPETGEIEVNASPGHELGDATLNQIIANTGVSQQQAQQIQANISLIHSTINNTDADTAFKYIQSFLTGQQGQLLQGTMQYLIKQAAQATAQGDTQTWLRTGTLGKVLGIIQSVGGPITSAAGAAIGGAVGAGARAFKNTTPPAPFGNTPIPELSKMP